MNVSDSTKLAYKETSIHKILTISFPDLGLTIPHSQIYGESMTLKESLLEKNSIEFVGCIASMFTIQVHGINDDLKGQKISVSIKTEGTEEIPLFNGIVDSAVKQSNKWYKKVTSYDELYTKGNIDVAAWYNGLTFPITLRELRDSLFEYVGLTQVARTLPNDSVTIEKKYEPKTLKALNVIKAVCQINGAFGIINRQGLFEYRILASEIVTGNIPYPATILFPSTGLFPANPTVAMSVAERTASEIEAETFSFYKKVDYEEFVVKPVDKVTIRQSENDTGVTYGEGTNNYIIQGNMFTYGLAEDVLTTIAGNIYQNVQGVSYHPFTSDNNGLPFVECGLDAVSYYMIDYSNEVSTASSDNSSIKNFYVFSRELKGIQNLRDSYGANGEEYQTEFITDLQTQIDIIKQDVKQEVDKAIGEYDFSNQFGEFTYDKAYLDKKFEDMTGWNHVLVDTVPTVIEPMTIYYVKGEVVVN